MQKELISIIIPVYNVEKYINRCLDSIINQTYKNIEIICINDGSTDNSLKILKEYEKNYSFIKIYDQDNSGPAITRNRGIKLVKSKYLMFIDSDDYIDCDYVENFYNNIKNTEYDIVIGGFKKTDGEKISFKRNLTDGEFSKYIVTGPVSKIYRTDFIKKNKIYFLDTNASEDIYFSVKAINKGAKIKSIKYNGYYYFDNLNSISNTKHKGFNKNIKIIDFLNKINYKDGPNITLNQYFIIRYCIWYLLYSGKNVSYSNFIKEYIKLFNWLKENIPDYRKNKYIKINGPKGEISSIGNIVFIFIILDKLNLVKIFAKIYCRGEKK